ncbi:MAG: TonB-dependent receptor [Bdellovibrionota bacterium]
MKKYLFLLSIPLLAQAHTEKLEVIEVTHGREESSLSSFIPSASVMKEKEILKRRESSLGDTLKNEVGIQTTSFGPSSGRPIIRGLDGNRIRVLQNGLGTLDASSQSLDHAIPIDTLTIDKVEIVRGPMSLLYGSSAVGGVVNIVNNRIHREYFDGAVSQFDVRGETVNNSLSLSNRIDYGKNKWMFHFDGSVQNMGDQEIPGYARSERLRSRAPMSPEPKDKIPNTFSKQNSFAVGASKIFSRGHAGFSYYRFDNDYGSITDPEVMIRMVQNRIEFSSEYKPEEGAVKSMRLRSAQSFYRHEEFEGDTVGTTFRNGGNESRLEFHTESGKLSGVTGLQTQLNTFRAAGDEAFLPASENMALALFSLQKLAVTEKDTVEFGARLEDNTIKKRSSANFGKSDEHNFVGLNGSLGYQHAYTKEYSLNGSFSYTERAPSFQEIHANGAHIATGQFERGDTGLKKEKAQAFELSFKKDSPSSFLTVSTYAQWFKDYIVLLPTAVTDAGSGFLVNEYEQENAIIYGAELDSREEITHAFMGGSWWWITKADATRGKGRAGRDLPRMPAPRLTFGVEYQRDQWDFDLEAQHYFDQTHRSDEELKTDAFTMVNFGVMYELPKEMQNYRFYFRVKNITDEEGRLSTSFVKDVAPMPGRNFLAGVQALF